MTISVHQYPCLTDNYGALIHDSTTGATACVDVPESAPTLAALAERGWNLTDILITHHHADHIQGVPDVRAKFPNAKIWGPAKDTARIPFLDHQVKEGDMARVGSLRAKVIETPGHTLGHIAYHFEDNAVAFCGDTLFSLGCGRVLETPLADGTYEHGQRLNGIFRSRDGLDERLRHLARCLLVERPIKRQHASKRGDWVSFERFTIAFDERILLGASARIGVLDDGRSWLMEFLNQLPGGIEIHQVVVGKLLAL